MHMASSCLSSSYIKMAFCKNRNMDNGVAAAARLIAQKAAARQQLNLKKLKKKKAKRAEKQKTSS